MPFKFAYICDLLEKLESFETREIPLLTVEKSKHQNACLDAWFKHHRRLVDAPDTDRVALLSTLFPERRTDRVYYLKERGLVKILGRCLGFGRERLRTLEAWVPSGEHDLPTFVSNMQRATEAGTTAGSMTVEAVDTVLGKLAAQCRFSSPEVRAGGRVDVRYVPDDLLRPILLRLSARDLRWFLRLLLKRLAPVILDETTVLRRVHFLLPRLLKFQSSFTSAVQALKDPLLVEAALALASGTPSTLADQIFAQHLRPQIGAKVGRPDFVKARSLKHCLNIAGKARWAIEPKYDGEYCQVHIDLTKGARCIQIFSKSGKDSTKDRIALHGWILSCLRIGQPDCKFRKKCILEGEMVVRSEETNTILEFHKIRKHVARSGTYIGTTMDSPCRPHEHLMMIFFDVLLIDDDIIMAQPYEKRRRHLRDIMNYYPGYCQTADWGTIDFGKLPASRAVKKVERAFAKAIAQRCEGLILKPLDRPYFSLTEPREDGKVMKLKKDYIPGLGDTADFAVIGARYDASEALKDVKNIKWTSFTIACLENKERVCRFGDRAIYKVMGSLSRPCISIPDMQHISSLGQFMAVPFDSTKMPKRYDLVRNSLDESIDVLFGKPFIVEVLGSSFEKPSGRNHYMLRHPRILKVHRDRSFEDIVSFRELQDMAYKATSLPADMIQEEAEWFEKLRKTFRQPDESSDITISQTTTESPASKRSSPRKSPRNSTPSALARRGRAHLGVPHACGNSTSPRDKHPSVPQTVERAFLPTPPTSSLPDVTISMRTTMPSDPVSCKRKHHSEALVLSRKVLLISKSDNGLSGCQISSTAPVYLEHHVNASQKQPLKDITNSPPKLPQPPTANSPDLKLKSSITRKSVRFEHDLAFADRTSASRVTTSEVTPDNRVADTASGDMQSLPLVPGHGADPALKTVPHKPPKETPTYIKLPSSLQPHLTSHFHDQKYSPKTVQPFGQHTLYISPCISSTPYVMHDLLPKVFKHIPTSIPSDAEAESQILTPPATPPLTSTTHLTRSLSHWVRDLHMKTTEILYNAKNLTKTCNCVHESQAYPGLQKVLLVEPRRVARTQELIRRVLHEVPLAQNEVIEVWDWRVLEAIVDMLDTFDDIESGLCNQSYPDIPSAMKTAMYQTQHAELAQALRQGYVGYVRMRESSGMQNNGGPIEGANAAHCANVSREYAACACGCRRINEYGPASEAEKWEKAAMMLR